MKNIQIDSQLPEELYLHVATVRPDRARVILRWPDYGLEVAIVVRHCEWAAPSKIHLYTYRNGFYEGAAAFSATADTLMVLLSLVSSPVDMLDPKEHQKIFLKVSYTSSTKLLRIE